MILALLAKRQSDLDDDPSVFLEGVSMFQIDLQKQNDFRMLISFNSLAVQLTQHFLCTVLSTSFLNLKRSVRAFIN
jgi:hypothetical protein